MFSSVYTPDIGKSGYVSLVIDQICSNISLLMDMYVFRRSHPRVCPLLVVPEQDPQLRHDPWRGPSPEPVIRCRAPEHVPSSQQGQERGLHHGLDRHGVRQRVLQDAASGPEHLLVGPGPARLPEDQGARHQVRGLPGGVRGGVCEVDDQDEQLDGRPGDQARLQGRPLIKDEPKQQLEVLFFLNKNIIIDYYFGWLECFLFFSLVSVWLLDSCNVWSLINLCWKVKTLWLSNTRLVWLLLP